jgi:hypothetical protein
LKFDLDFGGKTATDTSCPNVLAQFSNFPPFYRKTLRSRDLYIAELSRLDIRIQLENAIPALYTAILTAHDTKIAQ